MKPQIKINKLQHTKNKKKKAGRDGGQPFKPETTGLIVKKTQSVLVTR